MPRSKEAAKASYDRISKWYDWLARSERKYGYAGVQKLSPRRGEVVLEIGFGTGHSVLAMAHMVGPSGRVYGIDISEGMFNITQSRIREAGLSDIVELRCGDAASLPFEASFLDAILMSFTLELFDTPEIPVVLSECRRVLREGGRICVIALSKGQQPGVAVRVYEWVHTKFPAYVDCRPILLRRAMEEARFQILDVTGRSMFGLPVQIVLAQKALQGTAQNNSAVGGQHVQSGVDGRTRQATGDTPLP